MPSRGTDPGCGDHDRSRSSCSGVSVVRGSHPSASHPSGGGQAGLGVGPLVVAAKPGGERGVQSGEGQRWRGSGLSSDEVAGQEGRRDSTT